MRTLTRSKAVAALAAGLIVTGGGIAWADNIQDNIVDSGSVSLTAGDITSSGTATIKVIGNNSAGDPDNGCNFDTSSEYLELGINTPSGVTATPSTLRFTSCGTDQAITFTASSTAVGGNATATITRNGTDGTFQNQVSIPITITQPVPTNTAPSVTVTGVTASTYEIGAEPTPGCAVTDAQEPTLSATPVVDRTGLANGLGAVTVTCSVTDAGGLSDSDSANYTVVDTGDPTIEGSVSPSTPDGTNGWYRTAPVVSFACADVGGSGIASCLVDGGTSSGITLGEGADQSVSGTATDNAGNTASDTVSNLDVDLTDPTASFVGGPADGAGYPFGSVPGAPTCTASDDLSGPDGCSVSGYSTAVGTHTLTATATDAAGRTGTTTVSYDVLPFRLSGFYAPVDMSGVWNTVKGGSTVPLKFEVFAGSTELTSTSIIGASFAAKAIACPNGTTSTDEIEVLSTGGTTLRYDTTAGQFIQNWATPKKPGTCWAVTMTTADGTKTAPANFMLR